MKRTTVAEKRQKKTDALVDSVHRVIAAYIAHLGGKLVVSGPIEIQRWTGRKFEFTVGLKCCGRAPIKRA